VVDHLRWDLKQIFDMAIAEGHLRLNPALLLFTPRTAKRPLHLVMSIQEVRQAFVCLQARERLIAKLSILGGMRPGEIFGLVWGRVGETFAKVEQRIYRGLLDTPKTHHSVRDAALSGNLRNEIELWKGQALSADPEAYVFPSENLTPLSNDNVWRRYMKPKLAAVGLDWANFQVMRRTHATLMRRLKADPKLVADQLGHSLDVSLNVYAQSPVESRLVLVNELENLLLQ
jgi:integrase